MRRTSLDRLPVFSTGQIAELCAVAPRTVSKWIDSGRLPGSRVPDSKHRRVYRDPLVAFMREHGMPLGPLEQPCAVLLSQDQPLAQRIQHALGETLTLVAKETAFETGTVFGGKQPVRALILDCSMGPEAMHLPKRLASHRPEVVIAIDDEGVLTDLNERFSRPFDPALLVTRLHSLLRAA